MVILVASGIRVIKEWERAPVLRLGRFTGLKGPGIFYIIPFVDRIPNIISTRVQTIPFRTEQTLTKDNVPVNVDAIMFFQAVDVEKVILNVERYLDATTWAAQTTLREVMGKVSLDELLAEREKVGVEARNIIDEKTERWGIKVSSVEVKDIAIPQALQEAMSRQASAETRTQSKSHAGDGRVRGSTENGRCRESLREERTGLGITVDEHTLRAWASKQRHTDARPNKHSYGWCVHGISTVGDSKHPRFD